MKKPAGKRRRVTKADPEDAELGEYGEHLARLLAGSITFTPPQARTRATSRKVAGTVSSSSTEVPEKLAEPARGGFGTLWTVLAFILIIGGVIALAPHLSK